MSKQTKPATEPVLRRGIVCSGSESERLETTGNGEATDSRRCNTSASPADNRYGRWWYEEVPWLLNPPVRKAVVKVAIALFNKQHF